MAAYGLNDENNEQKKGFDYYALASVSTWKRFTS